MSFNFMAIVTVGSDFGALPSATFRNIYWHHFLEEQLAISIKSISMHPSDPEIHHSGIYLTVCQHTYHVTHCCITCNSK